MYGFSGFSKKDSDRLKARVGELREEKEVVSALVDHISAQVPPEMLDSPESADIQAVLTIENIEFFKKSGRVSLSTEVSVTFQSTESSRTRVQGIRLFHGYSAEYQLEQWLAADSPALREAIREGLIDAAGHITAALNKRWTPGDETSS